MREYLYRAQRKDNKEWVYWNAYGEYTDPFVSDTDMHSHVSECDVDPATVGMYTGLTDKNGRKIFEGDVLDENGYRFMVAFDQKWCKFKLQHDGKAIQYPEWNRGILMEVIGNIHDNPELLEATT